MGGANKGEARGDGIERDEALGRVRGRNIRGGVDKGDFFRTFIVDKKKIEEITSVIEVN